MRKMTQTELELIAGKAINLPMEEAYRDKVNCTHKAGKLIDQHLVNDMTQKQIQEEIFAHAVAYYRGEDLKALGGLTEGLADWLISKGETITIEDGGDSAIRQIGYTFIWNHFENA